MKSYLEKFIFAIFSRLFYSLSVSKLIKCFFFAAEKRFESVYDLVADGLITMYMDANAKDYIEDMAIKVVEDGKVSQNVATEKRQSLEVTSNQNDQVNVVRSFSL